MIDDRRRRLVRLHRIEDLLWSSSVGVAEAVAVDEEDVPHPQLHGRLVVRSIGRETGGSPPPFEALDDAGATPTDDGVAVAGVDVAHLARGRLQSSVKE